VSAFAFGSPGLAIAAGAAVSLPILIHLLLRRRRLPVEWAAMELLREALRRVERRRRLERILLLAVRCLLVAAAGLAIAAPAIGEAVGAARRTRTLVAVIDDSAASNELVDGTTALERSVSAARAAIESLAEGDRVAVVTVSRAATTDRGPASMDRRAAADRLRSIVPTELPCDLPGALATARAILSNRESDGSRRELLVCSAFRAGSVGAMPALAQGDASVVTVATMPPAAGAANLRIASVEAERVAGAGSGVAGSVLVTVARDRGDASVEATVRVTGPTLTAPAERRVTLAAGERERTLQVTVSERPADASGAPRRAVTAELSADAQPVDDRRSTVLAPVERLRATVVDRRTFDASGGIDRLSPGDWVARALAPGDAPEIDVAQVDPSALDARTIAGADAVILLQPRQASTAQWQALAGFVARGGMLAVAPSADQRAQPWTAPFAEAFGIPWKFDLEARDLDPAVALAPEMPPLGMLAPLAGEFPQLAPAVEAFRALRVDASMDAAAAQATLRDGTPFLLSWRPADARGSVVVLAAAIDLAWTTLPLKPLMVPMWQELVAEGRRRASAAHVAAVGSRPRIDGAGVVELRPVAADGSSLPGARAIPVGAGGRIAAPLERNGLHEEIDGSGTVRGMLAVVPDAQACSVAPVDADRVRAWLSSAGEFRWVGDGEGGTSGPAAAAGSVFRAVTSLAPWFFGAALALALLESLLARRFSHATRPAAAMPQHAPVRVAAGGAA
jgi:hypothetical protein